MKITKILFFACFLWAFVPVFAQHTTASQEGNNAFTGNNTHTGTETFNTLTTTGSVSVGGTLGATGLSTLTGGASGANAGTITAFKAIGSIFYADSYAVGSTTCGITEAITAAKASGSNTVRLPLGLCTATTAISLVDGIHLIGYGAHVNSNTGINFCGTVIKNATSDLFTWGAIRTNTVEIEGACFWSAAGGGHVFNFNAATSPIALFRLHDYGVEQDNAGKSFLVSTTATNNFVAVRISRGFVLYTVGRTTPAIDITSNGISIPVIEDNWFQESAGADTTPTIRMNQSAANSCAGATIRNNIFEPPSGATNYAGVFQYTNVCSLLMDGNDIDATGFTPTAPMILLTAVNSLPSGLTSVITLLNNISFGGSTTQPDLQVTQVTPSPVTLIGNQFAWVAGATGQPFGYIDVNNTIVNQHDTTVTKITPSALTLGGTFSSVGLLTKYNNVNTAANGVGQIVADINLTGQTASITSTLLYAVPSTGAGQYRASCYIVLTTPAGTSSTLPNCQIIWTDADSSVSTNALATSNTGLTTNVAGLNSGQTAAGTVSGIATINAKASTNINYATPNYASNAANAMAYAVHIKLEYLGN